MAAGMRDGKCQTRWDAGDDARRRLHDKGERGWWRGKGERRRRKKKEKGGGTGRIAGMRSTCLALFFCLMSDALAIRALAEAPTALRVAAADARVAINENGIFYTASTSCVRVNATDLLDIVGPALRARESLRRAFATLRAYDDVLDGWTLVDGMA